MSYCAMSSGSAGHKIEALLGFARKAGRLALGSSAIEVSLRKGRCRLLLFASDASAWTMRHLGSRAFRARIPVFAYSTRSHLGELFGRGWVAAVGIEDPQFARALLDLLAGTEEARRIEERELFPQRGSRTGRQRRSRDAEGGRRPRRDSDPARRNGRGQAGGGVR